MTTKKEDEYICLATVLDLDVLEPPPRPCMINILKQLDEIAVQLLFTPGSRSARPDRRWSPMTFLAQWSHRYSRTEDFARLTPYGIQVQERVLFIEGEIVLTNEDDSWTTYVLPFPDGENRKTSSRITVVKYRRDDEERATTVIQNPVIVVSSDPKGEGTSRNAIIIIRQVRVDNGVLYGHYEAFAVDTLVGSSGREICPQATEDSRWLQVATHREIDVSID